MGIEYAKFKFSLLVNEHIVLNRFIGTTLRGSFGITLKERVCIFSVRKSCENCLVRYVCAYSFLFETPVQPDQKQLFTHGERAPHPYIFEPPLGEHSAFDAGTRLNFNVVLLCKAIEYLPYFIYVFEVLGNKGLGRGRGKFYLEEVTSEAPNAIPLYTRERPTLNLEFPIKKITYLSSKAPIRQLKIEFLTPTSLKYQGRFLRHPRFNTIFINLVRRLKALFSLYGDGEPLEVPPELIERAAQIETVEKSTYWDNYQRFSNRQKQIIDLGGIVGSMTFKGDLEPFLPYLQMGEILHIGKNTVFGFGKYQIKIEG